LHIYNDDTSDAASPTIRLERKSLSTADDDKLGKIEFHGWADGRFFLAPTAEYANITGVVNDASSTGGDIEGQLDFNISRDGTLTTGMSLTDTTLELLNGTDLDVDGNIKTDVIRGQTTFSNLDFYDTATQDGAGTTLSSVAGLSLKYDTNANDDDGFKVFANGNSTACFTINNAENVEATGSITATDGFTTSSGNFVTTSGNLATNAGNIIANSGTLTLGSDATIGGNISVTGTVDGRDVATDGARLDTIPYHRVRDDRLSSFNRVLDLTTSNQNLGQYQNLYHPSTPVETMRFVDIEWSTVWSYVNSSNNDIRLSLYLTVPSTVSAVSIGTASAFSSSSYYSARNSNEQWYYVSGDYTHLFTEFGRISQSSSGSIKQQVVSAQYQADADRTYFCATNTTAPIATGDTVYFHPYAWQNANASLLVYKDIAERYRSGTERHNVNFKLPYTDETLYYKLNIKELSSTDSAQVKDAQVRITSTGI
jgi:hypothetical protein